MSQSPNLKRQFIKKYESTHLNVLELCQNEEYMNICQKEQSKKNLKISKNISAKLVPAVYISKVIEQIIESLHQFLITELSLYKIDKNKYSFYWSFLQSSFIFIWIESMIYMQDKHFQENDAFSAQLLRISQYFSQSTDLLQGNYDEELYKNWITLYDYFEKIINVNFSKMNKFKQIFSTQYFCLGYTKNIIESFKKQQNYQLPSKEQDMLQEISQSIMNQKMRDYLLDDEDGQEVSQVSNDKSQNLSESSQSKDVFQSAQFNALQSQQSNKTNKQFQNHLQQDQNISKPYIMKIESNHNLEGIQKHDQSIIQSYQNTENQMLNQQDLKNNEQNKQNNISNVGNSKARDQQQTVQFLQDNQSIKSNNSNHGIQTKQQQQNAKKRESILLNSSQFEFQNNIKNGGTGQYFFSANGQNYNNIQFEIAENISYSSQFLCKEDELLNQNGENITINNEFFSRKVSDNLLDDLDQMQQAAEAQTNQKLDQTKRKSIHFSNQLVSSPQVSQSFLSNESSESLIQQPYKQAKKIDKSQSEKRNKEKKLERISDVKSKMNNQDNNRMREFSFKHDIIEQKKEVNSLRTIMEIENFINQELFHLNMHIDQLQNGNVHEKDERFQDNIPVSSFGSNRKSKVRGSNLGIRKVSSDNSVYDLHSSQIEDNDEDQQDCQISENDESDNSSDSIGMQYSVNPNKFTQPYQIFNRLKEQDRMERYNNDEIILDQNEDEEVDSCCSLDHRESTRSRSNVYVMNSSIRKKKNQGDVQKQQYQKKDNFKIRKRSRLNDDDDIILEQQSSSQKYSSQNQSNQTGEHEEGQYEQLSSYFQELEENGWLTLDEIYKIQIETIEDLQNVNINLDHTLVGNGIAKNYEKYSFPLEVNYRNTYYNKRLQEKYKLLQNFQHLLGVDSSIFATELYQMNQNKQVIAINNKEYLKMLNKLPEDQFEQIEKKKKKIEESEKNYKTRRNSKNKYSFEIKLTKMQESDNILDDILEESSSERERREALQTLNYGAIKRNSQETSNFLKRKSVEQVMYNVHEDEIEEEDRFFHDEEGKEGFSHQVYAVNKHNYYLEFKKNENEDLIQMVFDQIEAEIQEEKNEEQELKNDPEFQQDPIIYLDQTREIKLPLYSLSTEINEKVIQQSQSISSCQQQFSWNKARVLEQERKALAEAKTIFQNQVRQKRSVVIQEDLNQELILRHKNLSTSPTKKQNYARKARKRSGSFNPESIPEEDNPFVHNIKKFQQSLNLNKSLTLIQTRSSQLS